VVKVDSIQKTFGYNEVLKGVSFQIEDGTIYGLIGKNGAGKTTLMNIMTGLMESDGGNCTITETGSDKIIDNKSRKIGYLPDLPAFYDYLTTDEYLDYLLKNENPIRRNELLKLVGLPQNAKVKTMSRGMRQRLGIAAVLVNDPDIILLDESTSALDPSGRQDVMDILLKLKEEGKTILLSTHILADMDKICDKAGFLNNGVIVREVNIAESKKNASIMVISFKTEPDLETLYNYVKQIEIMDPLTIRLRIDEKDKIGSQQTIMTGLAALGQEIASISSAALSLDGIFQEVCR
jgi:ABC-2 type transport system ATP-binding protein